MSDAYEIFKAINTPTNKPIMNEPNYLEYLLEFADLNGLEITVSVAPDVYKHKYEVELQSKIGRNKMDIKDGCMLRSQAHTGNTLNSAARFLLEDTYKQMMVFGMDENRKEVFGNYLGLKSLLNQGVNY